MPQTHSADPNALEFGTIIGAARLLRGWSLGDLAKRAGMNADYLGRLERGVNSPTLTMILKIAEALGEDAAVMVGRVEEARRKRIRPATG